MAVAVQTAGMGTREGAGVHPFFSSVKHKGRAATTTHQNIKSFLTTGQNDSTNHTVPAVTSLASLQLNYTPIETESSSSAQLPIAPRAEESEPPASEERPGLNESQQSTHSAFREPENNKKDKHNITAADTTGDAMDLSAHYRRWQETGTESEDLEIDPNENRRKRRLTASVQNKSSGNGDIVLGTWEEQLKAAALSSQIVHSNEEEGSPDISQNAGTTSQPFLMTIAPPQLPHTPSLEPLKERPDARNPTIVRESPGKRGTPQKKMLKIRSNGKLASPKAKTEAAVSKSNRKTSVKGKSASKSSVLVVLSYGSDAETRASFGAKVEHIFESTSLNRELSLVKMKASSALPKPEVPLKTTHPFFLGNIPRFPAVDIGEDEAIARRNPISPLMDSERTSPRKKVSTVTPSAAKAWEAIGEQRSTSVAKAFANMTRFPGAVEPMWPPTDMQHCRGLTTGISIRAKRAEIQELRSQQKRLKTTQILVTPQEDVFSGFRHYYHQLVDDKEIAGNYRRPSLLRKPERKLMTGCQLQEALRPRLVAKLPFSVRTVAPIEFGQQAPAESVPSDILSPPTTHSALIRVYRSIENSLSGFDRYECDNRDWALKYSPKDAANILQPGREVGFLRDWLKSLAVMSVDNGISEKPAAGGLFPASKRGVGRPRKRKKRAEGLDGFLISSDEDGGEMDELAGLDDKPSADADSLGTKKSIVRIVSGADPSNSTDTPSVMSNAVVISGPHGCGKTATVYAVAQELGFEVFELNSGSRRSGKDILDRVGDMTRNHLVHQKHTDEAGETDGPDSATVQLDIDSGRQSTMQSFLKPKAKSKLGSKARPKAQTKETTPQDPARKQKKQKQSLILLEEVDILFEEDKQFWSTIIGLIHQSRRPIIMTCTDESLLPLDDMVLHAIFRLTPTPEDLAVDYLILIAGNEGHLLSRDAVSTLYKSKYCDLRASIAELNVWCQMAIGDTKGGLDWMLIGSKACHNEQGQRLRVVSDGTYLPYMGTFSRDSDHNALDKSLSSDVQLLLEALREWDVEVGDCCELVVDSFDCIGCPNVTPLLTETYTQHSPQTLKTFDLLFDAQSAGDMLHGLSPQQDNNVFSAPPLLRLFPTNMHRPYSTQLNPS